MPRYKENTTYFDNFWILRYILINFSEISPIFLNFEIYFHAIWTNQTSWNKFELQFKMSHCFRLVLFGQNWLFWSQGKALAYLLHNEAASSWIVLRKLIFYAVKNQCWSVTWKSSVLTGDGEQFTKMLLHCEEDTHKLYPDFRKATLSE